MLQITRKKKRRKNPKRTSSHSTMTADRKRALAALAAPLLTQGERVAAGLDQRLRTVLEEGEEMPDLRFLLELFARLLRRSARDLDATDAAGWKQRMRLSELRFECRKVRNEVHAAAVRIRKALVELVGSKRCRFQFGLSPRTPRGAEDLAIEARRLVSRLAEPELPLPASRLPGLEADPETWVAELSPTLERLERLLEEIELRRIAAGDGVIARKKALDDSAETCRLVTGASQALFALAGEKELARRLRPARRRPRPTAGKAKTGRPDPRTAATLRAAAVTLFEWLRRVLRRLRSTADALIDRGGWKSAESAGFPLSPGRSTAQIP